MIEPPPPPAAFFSDSNFEGDWLWLNRGMEWRDLTQVDRGDFWNRQSWNDCISSVSPVPNLGLVVLCEDINLEGRLSQFPSRRATWGCLDGTTGHHRSSIGDGPEGTAPA